MKIVYLITCIFLASCTTVGKRFDASMVLQFEPGVTTMTDAIRLFKSDPQNIITMPDGSKIVTWNYIAGTMVGAKMVQVGLNFAPDGKLSRVANLVGIPTDEATLARLNPVYVQP